jgi:hypothetical protein
MPKDLSTVIIGLPMEAGFNARNANKACHLAIAISHLTLAASQK